MHFCDCFLNLVHGGEVGRHLNFSD